jgi:uridine kinase
VNKESENFKVKVRESKTADSIIKGLPQAEVYLIGGPSGAGKTEFARALSKVKPAVTISLDDYFLDEKMVRFSVTSRYGLGRQWDHPSSVDLNLASRNVIQLLDAKRTHLPVFSFAENRRTGYRECKRRQNDAIVVEGLHALLIQSILRAEGRTVCSIFVNGAVSVRRNRVSVRDAKTRKRPLSDFDRRFYFMRIAETRWINPQSRKADLVFDTSEGFFGVIHRTLSHSKAKI